MRCCLNGQDERLKVTDMKSIKLYRILAHHAGVINALAADVYHERKEADEALALAKAAVEKLSNELKEDEGA